MTQIVPIESQHDEAICRIIKSVGEEFGAVGDGFGPSDAEVLAMSTHYTEATKSLYLVALLEGEVVGGGGIASFNASHETCELKKLFLLPRGRGQGIGKQITEQCLAFAKTQGYAQCYLDTLSNMTAAISLYESVGFAHRQKPLAATPHGNCNVWMMKNLS